VVGAEYYLDETTKGVGHLQDREERAVESLRQMKEREQQLQTLYLLLRLGLLHKSPKTVMTDAHVSERPNA